MNYVGDNAQAKQILSEDLKEKKA